METIKKYESYGTEIDWISEFREICEEFYQIEEKMWDINKKTTYEAGWITISDNHPQTYVVKFEDNKISGQTELMSKKMSEIIKNYQNKMSVKITIETPFGYTPFSKDGIGYLGVEFFDEEYKFLTDMINNINSIGKKIVNYKMGVTFYRGKMVVNLMRNRK